jgi:hypothetical protein
MMNDLSTDFKYKTLPSVEEIKRVGKNIRVHPNGFIQLDLEDGYRLHFFLDNAVYVRFPQTPIHTHAFVLESRVLVGEITNVEYEVAEDPQGDLCLYRAMSMETPLEKVEGVTYSISDKKEQIVKVGEAYAVKTGVFHESLHKGDTITVVRKIRTDAICQIDVLCQKGQKPSESLDRKSIPEPVLWERLESVLKKT